MVLSPKRIVKVEHDVIRFQPPIRLKFNPFKKIIKMIKVILKISPVSIFHITNEFGYAPFR